MGSDQGTDAALQEERAPQSELWKLDVVFPAVSGQGEQYVDQIVDELTRRGKCSDVDLFAVRMALSEAIQNAVEHGSKYDASKNVFLSAEVDDRIARISVRDEGQGFRPEDTPDPTLDENLETPSGRGLFLIRNFMTRVWHNIKGNEIFMEKELASETKE